jgi:hypothetical protein
MTAVLEPTALPDLTTGPVWATELDPDGGSNVWSHTHPWKTGDLDGNSHSPSLYRSEDYDGTITEADNIYPMATDYHFTVPAARQLAKAIIELCDIAEAAQVRSDKVAVSARRVNEHFSTLMVQNSDTGR